MLSASFLRHDFRTNTHIHRALYTALREQHTHLENSDVPGVALHSLLQFSTFQALLSADPVQIFMEIQPCKTAPTHSIPPRRGFPSHPQGRLCLSETFRNPRTALRASSKSHSRWHNQIELLYFPSAPCLLKSGT